MTLRSTLILLLSLLPLQPVAAASITLYDDTQGNLPGNQPWLFYGSDSIFGTGVATQTAIASGVQLVTDNGVSAGYSNYAITALKNSSFPALDRTLGFSLELQLQVNSENHSNANRAGFSLILLDSDAQGVEIGFWDDRVWAQEIGFTHAEEALFDTVVGEHLYELAILGGSYTLNADGNPLLSGSLRDYSGSGATPLFDYDLPDFLFLGDDTSSAGANVNLGQITLNVNKPASIPAPGGTLLLFTGFMLLRRRLRDGQLGLRKDQT